MDKDSQECLESFKNGDQTYTDDKFVLLREIKQLLEDEFSYLPYPVDQMPFHMGEHSVWVAEFNKEVQLMVTRLNEKCH